MQVIAKSFTIPEFKEYVANVKFDGWTPRFVVVHNTDVPNQALYKKWHEKPKWRMEQWLKNLTSFYANVQHWNGCPHLFVGYDKIGVLNPLHIHGTHTPTWNKFTWGVETVGDFTNEKFDGSVRDNLIAALGILHSRVGLNPVDFKLGVRGIHFHKEDLATTHKTCPGKNMNKLALVNDVLKYMNKDGETHADVPIASQEANTEEMSYDELVSIKWLQDRLNSCGYGPLAVDGQIGDATKKATRKFQKDHSLKVDGVAGPVTRKLLKETNHQ